MLPARPLRHRSAAHRRFVATLRCLVCRRDPPSDPHHLKFAQPRARGLKSGDQWTVPLCQAHHVAVEAAGDETQWWANQGVNPVPLAIELWTMTTRRAPSAAV